MWRKVSPGNWIFVREVLFWEVEKGHKAGMYEKFVRDSWTIYMWQGTPLEKLKQVWENVVTRRRYILPPQSMCPRCGDDENISDWTHVTYHPHQTCDNCGMLWPVGEDRAPENRPSPSCKDWYDILQWGFIAYYKGRKGYEIWRGEEVVEDAWLYERQDDLMRNEMLYWHGGSDSGDLGWPHFSCGRLTVYAARHHSVAEAATYWPIIASFLRYTKGVQDVCPACGSKDVIHYECEGCPDPRAECGKCCKKWDES